MSSLKSGNSFVCEYQNVALLCPFDIERFTITETNHKRKTWPSKEWNGFLTGSTGATLGWWWSTLRKRCVASGSFNVPGRTTRLPLQKRRRCCSASANLSIATLYTACSCYLVPWLQDNTPIREFSMPGN